jgi:hypothetical protein
MPDEQKEQFNPSTGHLDDIGAPPVPGETQVQPVSAETLAAFDARATEANISADIRKQLVTILGTVGEIAARKFLGL